MIRASGFRGAGFEGGLSDGEAASEAADGGAERPPPDGALGAEGSPSDGSMDGGGNSCVDAAIGADCSQSETSDACETNPCEHGAACLGTPGGASCDCTGTGYTGDKCEEDAFDECSSPNVCTSSAYPCVQTEPPGYTCEGRLADWPMPDAVPVAKVTPSYDFTTNPELVADKIRGLIWQRYLPERYPGCSSGADVAESSCSWQEAKDYCKALVLGGRQDWRLPTRIELESIYSVAHALNGGVDPLASPESVTDTRTGLTWQRSLGLETYAWNAAVAHCANLGAGWRIPTKNELVTLIDPLLPILTGNGCIDLGVFPSRSGAVRLWTVTTFPPVLSGQVDRMLIDTSRGGPARSSSEMDLAHVRCLR